MAHFSPEHAFDELKGRLTSTIAGYFPLQGTRHEVRAKRVWVDDHLHIDDIKSQEDAKLKGRTWSVPIKGELELIDRKTGKVKDSRTVTIAQLPKITRRYSYIVDGNERQVVNQFRLRPGVYTRIKENGELGAQWNVARGRGFEMNFDPEARKLSMRVGSSNVALYPVLHALGVSDPEIEQALGRELLVANRTDKHEPELKKLHKVLSGGREGQGSIQQQIAHELGRAELDPTTAQLTLGHPFKQVDGKSLLAGARKMLRVSRQEEEPDDRDSLEFKRFLAAEDLIEERLQKRVRPGIVRKLLGRIDRREQVNEVVSPDLFGQPLKGFFTSTSHSELPEQFNPLSFVGGQRRTTVLGEGGVSDPQKLTLEAKSISPSHFGYLDSLTTPESAAIGATMNLASGVEKKGDDLVVKAFNARSGKFEDLTARKAARTNLAFPDQYIWEGNKPRPRAKLVKVITGQGETELIPHEQVDFIYPSAKAAFDISSNLIPFLHSDQGNRTSVATRQLEQAVSLVHREAPLVQTKGEKEVTFEQALGRFNSHQSPVDGVVETADRDRVVVRGKDGAKHEVQLYRDFPLNENKSVLNSELLVEKGSRVKKGQVIADTNFTKDGSLALGANLRVAYIPWKGLNHEDAVVISESAAKRLTSEHMHRFSERTSPQLEINKRKFLAETAGQWTKQQADKLDDDGVIREGTLVQPGDPLIAVLRHEPLSVERERLGLFSKKLVKPVQPRPKIWEKDYPGEVTRVVRHGKDVTVYVKVRTPAEIGDKMVGRHGNKGVISKILVDHEMPHDAEGRPMEILLNPAGIVSRINLGQALETAASKIAVKTGKPYVVNNFDPSVGDQTRALKRELEEHGLSDTEDLTDPTTGKQLSAVLTGQQYMLKLHHMAEKGIVARSRGPYDLNMTPARGGAQGGQRMDVSGLYALLAHGALENVRESQSTKSDMNDDLWIRLQSGEPLPPPKIPFTYQKFEGYLRAMGVNVEKNGHRLQLSPLTDEQVLKMSSGELKDPARPLRGKDLKPAAGSIFDPKITGTRWPEGALGDKWSHVELAEHMPNPVFERPIRALLGLSEKDYAATIAGDQELQGKTGPAAIVGALQKVDVGRELKALERQLPELRGPKLDRANKQLRYLRALQSKSLTPVDAYAMKLLPVLPPNMRPISFRENGDLNQDDLNGIYRAIGEVNQQLKGFDKALPEEERHPLRAELYDGLRSLTLSGMDFKNRHYQGVAEIIAGQGSPKLGFFQRKMIGRRQDLSMRGVIVPEPSLALDEVGLPRRAAEEIYKPFVVRRLVRMGFTPLQAQQEVKKSTPAARRALEVEVDERPMMLKRDPVLHRYGVQAFRPKLVGGHSIMIHPLVTDGFSADFDGDKMSGFLPISEKAVAEARKMFPSNNLFSSSHGGLMYVPKQEAVLGLHQLTRVGRDTGHKFETTDQALSALRNGKIGPNDRVTIGALPVDEVKLADASARPVKTTLSRLALYQALPKGLRDKRLLEDSTFSFDKKQLREVLSRTAREQPLEFGRLADRLKDLGNEAATGLSFGLDDLMAETEDRDRILGKAQRDEQKIRRDEPDVRARRQKLVDLYAKAGEEITAAVRPKFERGSNRMYDWVRSQARGNWDQFRQTTVAPVQMVDSKGRAMPVPVPRSYSEGLDVGSYWTALYGARMGTIGRVEGTSKPGERFKGMTSAAMNLVVADDDCGTSRGIVLPTASQQALGRFTSKAIHLPHDKGEIPAGSIVGPELLTRLRNNKLKDVPVRTPLKCEHAQGVCAKCAGLGADGQVLEKGTNVGVIAAHALGEPLTQMAMVMFHEGGVAGSKGARAVDRFTRFSQLTEMPRTLPDAATLSHVEGAVDKVEDDPAGGWQVHVAGRPHFVPARRTLAVSVGQQVKKGESLSSGSKNPHEMLPLTGLSSVQRYLADELEGLYDTDSPLHRRNTEVMVRALTNLGEVEDPGDHEEALHGDVRTISELHAFNRQLPKGGRPVQFRPILKGSNVIPLEMQEDWIARLQSRRLRETLLEGAAQGWTSDVHGPHPIPAMAMGAQFGHPTEGSSGPY